MSGADPVCPVVRCSCCCAGEPCVVSWDSPPRAWACGTGPPLVDDGAAPAPVWDGGATVPWRPGCSVIEPADTLVNGVVSSLATCTPRVSTAVEAPTVDAWPSSRSRIWSAEGRSAGDFASAERTTLCSGSCIMPTSTSWLRIRLSTIAMDLPSKATSPVAAKAMVAPQENTSV